MKILITGATGFIGRHLGAFYREQGAEVVALSRNPHHAQQMLGEGIRTLAWDGRRVGEWGKVVAEVDAIIHLAGENVAARYWTKGFKQRIRDSRVHSAAAMAEAIRRASPRPRVFLQASATGFYGHRGEEELDEMAPVGEGFLAGVVRQWEAVTAPVDEMGVRRVVTRFGVVLGRKMGMLGKLELPFRLFLGGYPGDGRQWLSWIHIADVVQGIDFLLRKEAAEGVYNFTTPHPVRMKTFCRELAKVLHRPCWAPQPEFLLKLIFREMAREMLLVSQKVYPRRLMEEGFSFRFPRLSEALRDLLG
ncbi:MAG: TIGR01777 family protein [Calditrichaeota bacterium]|nr:MAG: TIGR01777 family protein [Calditrichota bacterium]